MSSRHSQAFGKQSYVPQVPKGFTVRVFKGPAVSSFPLTAPAKFDLGYRAIPLTEPRQSQHWYPSRSRTTSTSMSAPSEPSKSSRSQMTDNSISTTNRRGGYEFNSRSAAQSYAIYQSSKDTYVYERSLSSKSDINSNSEYDDASTTAFTPSSAFSPAMSTDSITTVRGVITPDASLTDLRSTTPTPFRPSIPSFPVHIPSLSQAQSAIRGIFRTQTPPQGGQSSYTPHAPSARPTPLPGSADAGRSVAPIRLSTTSSGSGDWTRPHDTYSTTSSAEQAAQYARARSPISESEHSELDRVAKANAEYNAASSASSSAYYSARDSVNFSTASSSAPSGVSDPSRQIYTNLPLRSSPEQQHAFVHSASSYTGDTVHPSSYHTATDATSGVQGPNGQLDSSYPYEPSESESTITTQSERSIPPLGEWVENMERRQAPPVRRQPEERSPSQIPVFRNEGPSTSRYVPASRTMPPSSQPAPLSTASSEPTVALRENDRPLPVPPPPVTQPWSSQRERKTSISQPPVSSTSSLFYASQGDGAPSHTPDARNDEPRRRSPVEQLPTSYAPLTSRPSDLPPTRDYASTSNMTNHRSPDIQPPPAHAPASFRTSPEQMHRLPSTHYPAPSQDYLPAPHSGGLPSNNATSPTARHLSTSTTQAAPLRTSPEQMHRLPSAHHTVAHTHANAPVLSSGGVSSNHVSSSAARRRSMSPQGRRDSIVIPTRAPGDPYIAANSAAMPPQSRSSQQKVQNSPPLDQQDGYQAREPRLGDEFAEGSRSANAPSVLTSYPTHPSLPVSASTSQRYIAGNDVLPVRTRYNNDQRVPDFIPNQQPFAPPSASSDPGPERDSRRTSFLEPQRTGGGGASSVAGVRALPIPATPSGARSEAASSIPESETSRSRTPFQDGRRPPTEPQRRHSDGDQSVASSSCPPPHLSYAASASASAVPIDQQPQRRYSDGDRIDANPAEKRSLALFRTVRWNENLVCPSPIFAHQRRKGWFNRRGDQLWTNDGAYKSPPAGQEYPPDLADYPEHGEGWMNEESVRIDMGHRLIPKAPLKSALKQIRSQPIQLVN